MPFEARAECATANEFRFKDHPNEIKFAPVIDQAIAEISTQYDLVHMIEKGCFIEVATNDRAAPLTRGKSREKSIAP